MMPRVLRTAAAALACALALPAVASASRDQESWFQDDNRLVFSSTGEVTQTLDEIRALGAERLRVSVFWRAIAPGNTEDRRPQFDAADPGAYPAGAWEPYDRLVRLASERGLRVNFDITGPAPDWATGTPAREDIDATYTPDAAEFGRFVQAVARRYGDRVDSWSIWNEPNQAGWLTPQWVQRGGRWVEASPRLYRALADAAWAALQAEGQGGDTILVGETAPKGLRTNRGETRSIDALRFVRRLYCLDDNLQVLTGEAAAEQGCPGAGAPFAQQHPVLFRATGFAHHPYELLFAPNRRPTWRDWATMANLPDLSLVLRRAHQRYGVALRGNVPLYLTEFGYQTRPPDRSGVAPAQQAAYLNHAEYIAYANRDVRALAQFLLVDDSEPVTVTFQSGLRFRDGRRKPAWRAYRLPIHVPRPQTTARRPLRVFGLARGAGPSRPVVEVQYRSRSGLRWRAIRRVRAAAPRGHLDIRLRLRRSGQLRLAWDGRTSRAVAVRVGPAVRRR